MYSDSIAVSRSTIERNPDCWLAANNLGTEWLKAGKQQEAIECFRTAIKIRSNYYAAYDNLGSTLVSIGQIEAAIPEFEHTWRSSLPMNVRTTIFGLAYEQLGDLEASLGEFEKTYAQDNALLRSHFNAANVLVKLNRPQEAVEQYRQALSWSRASRQRILTWPIRWRAWGRRQKRSANIGWPSTMMRVIAMPITIWPIRFCKAASRPKRWSIIWPCCV